MKKTFSMFLVLILSLSFVATVSAAADFGAAGEHTVLPEDMKTALEIGVQAEIDNISMYESFLKQDLPEDVRDVFENLKNGSVNHLRAFRNNLRRY